MNEGHMPDSRNRTSEIGSILSVRLRAQNGRLANDLVWIAVPEDLGRVPFFAFESTRLRRSHRRGTAILILALRPVVRYSATS